MSTLNLDFSQKGAATTEPVYMARRPIKNLVKPRVNGQKDHLGQIKQEHPLILRF